MLELLSEGKLEHISGGSLQSNVQWVGRIVTFPIRTAFYIIGAVVASLPRGFVDGFCDSITNWEEYEREIEKNAKTIVNEVS